MRITRKRIFRIHLIKATNLQSEWEQNEGTENN